MRSLFTAGAVRLACLAGVATVLGGCDRDEASAWALREPITAYRTNPAAFKARVDSMFFGGRHIEPPGGTGASPTTREISALEKAKNFQAGKAGANGAVLARLRNVGDTHDPLFNMRPDPAYEYYVVVRSQQGKKHEGTFEVVELRITEPIAVDFVARGEWIPCAPSHGKRKTSSARFGGCRHVPRPASAAGAILELLAPTAQAMVRTGGGWVSCDAGCCELSMERN